MTLIEVEIAILAVVFLVGVVLFWRASVKLLHRLYERQAATDKYFKAVSREVLLMKGAAEAALAQAQNMREDTASIQQRIETHIREHGA